MKRDTVSGILLIASSVVGVVAMARHPTGLLSAGADVARQGQLAVWVHAVAIAMTVLLFMGLLGLTRRLIAAPDLAVAAQIAFGCAVVGVTIAAAVSGLVGPHLAQRYLAADQATRPIVHELFHYNHLINQVFARIHVFASSVAVILWSVAIIRTGALSKAAGVVGVALGLGTLAGFFLGPLHLDAHGVLLLALGQAVWMIWVGVELLRERRAVNPG